MTLVEPPTAADYAHGFADGYKQGLKDEESEIVRCKDCEYGEQDEYGRWYCRGFGCQVGDEDGNGFCSDAERKNNV